MTCARFVNLVNARSILTSRATNSNQFGSSPQLLYLFKKSQVIFFQGVQRRLKRPRGSYPSGSAILRLHGFHGKQLVARGPTSLKTSLACSNSCSGNGSLLPIKQAVIVLEISKPTSAPHEVTLLSKVVAVVVLPNLVTDWLFICSIVESGDEVIIDGLDQVAVC